MEVVINLDSDVPPFSQLVDQIKSAVREGVLKASDSLPSIRQLANDLGLNHNTVAKAYRKLERDKIIQGKGYRGTFVHPEAVSNCQVNTSEFAKARFDEVIEKLRASGLTDSEIRSAFNRAVKTTS